MAPSRLLIVDDDVQLGSMLSEYLAGEGFLPQQATSGPVALKWLTEQAFDLVILDIMMPQMNGLEVLRALRVSGETPVLMLTARGDEEDRIVGLELGADDYLSKPFNPRELTARVRAILRRGDPRPEASRTPVTVGGLRLDPRDMSVVVDGAPVRLTTAEFMVLEALARSSGRALTRAVLTYRALGRPLEAFDRSVDTHVSNIRRKLRLTPGHGLDIRGLRGQGYVLNVAAAAA